ncbi:unnamed protein product [Mytilus coruscus]|uniref:Uncharacterized protein n=1 Tax=Mytilus coruscus TaxID=42192 RepID=A0A6J8DW53_MYTCO|nr:unnamed protein product [Mytilus coruscus]
MGDKTYPLDDNYSKEQTVRVNVGDTQLISPEPVIDEIEKKCGVGSVLACVPKNGTGYEVVMRERRNVGEISGDSMSIQVICSKQGTSDDVTKSKVIKAVADIHTSSIMCDDVEFNGEDGNGEDAYDNGDDEDEFTDADESMEDDVTETVDNASDNGEKTKIATDNGEKSKIATDNG